MAALPPGSKAPAFNLKAKSDQSISLSDYKGKPVVLVFYPADWSPVCSNQLALYNEISDQFAKYRAQVLGISVDNFWTHQAFAEHNKIAIPLLSDFEPKGQIAQDYGVYRKGDGVCERALFVIDGEGTIRWSFVSPIGVNPGAEGILKALESL